MRLILGSASPRRKELLAQIGVRADAIMPPDVDETPLKAELPRAYCRRISLLKAQAIVADPSDIILCGDTTVALGRRIMGKPADRTEADRFLSALSGRRHRVITAITLRKGEKIWQKEVQSAVKMKPLSQLEKQAYLDSEDWRGKAGGYGIQGPAAAFIPWISGSFSAIVGLPLAETAGLLHSAGYPVYQGIS
ncbi:septum formation protein Maf [Rhodobacteraceae bacterium IMCC1335]